MFHTPAENYSHEVPNPSDGNYPIVPVPYGPMKDRKGKHVMFLVGNTLPVNTEKIFSAQYDAPLL